MPHEKKKILIRRIILLGLLLLSFIMLVIIISAFIFAPPKEVEITDDNGWVKYDESLNQTNYDINVICRVPYISTVNSAYITVAFYDADDNLLAKEKQLFFVSGNNRLSSTFDINGEVAYYEITDYDISASRNLRQLLFLCLFIISLSFFSRDIFIWGFFIASLFLSYKVQEYNGNEIIVYAGWYHNYIKVNGIKTAEHNTLMPFKIISLSCTLNDGADVKATITITNKISLKINNQLYDNNIKAVR